MREPGTSQVIRYTGAESRLLQGGDIADIGDCIG